MAEAGRDSIFDMLIPLDKVDKRSEATRVAVQARCMRMPRREFSLHGHVQHVLP